MSIHDLGQLTGGTFAFANGVSSNGSVIVGQGDTTGSAGLSRAWRWTGGVFTNLGILSGGSYSIARACSADGSIVVGEADNSSGQPRAFKWTAGGGMVNLGVLGTGTQSSAYGISDDGSTIVGFSTTTPTGLGHPFSWSGSMVDLGLPSFANSATQIAVAASTTGSVIVGQTNGSGLHAWKWSGSYANLGALGADTSSYAQDCSSDGSLIVGYDPSVHGWYWSGGSLTQINPPLGQHDFVPSGVSGDGLTLTGTINFFSGTEHAVTWTIANAYTLLPELAGAMSSANSISTDGSTVVGNALSDDGFHAVYWDTVAPPVLVDLSGVSATDAVGALTALLRPALAMTDFVCAERITADPEVSLRWSDTRGASWSSWIRKPFTVTGQYDIDVAFYRLGLARDRIWEISWATPSASALTGAFISYEIAGS